VTGLATAFGSGAMTNNIADIDHCQTLFVIGSNTTEQHPVIGTRIRRAVRRGAQLIVADPRMIDLANIASVYLRHRPGTDIALLNGMAHIILKEGWEDKEFIAQRTEGFDEWRKVIETYTPTRVSEITGVSVEDLYTAARLYATNKPSTIFYAMGITQHTVGHNNVLAVANLAMVTGNIGKPGAGVDPLRGQNNVQGACDVGALPNFFTGYQRVADDAARTKFENAWGVKLPATPGLTVGEMFHAAHDGKVKAMWISGENVAMSDPDSHHVVEALERLDFLVVSELFMTETAQLADVVLPAASFAEKDGTFTNTERRVQRVRKAIEPIGEARADWEIVCAVAHRLLRDTQHASRWDYASAEEIMQEIASLTPSYAGITYARIDQRGLQWPVPARIIRHADSAHRKIHARQGLVLAGRTSRASRKSGHAVSVRSHYGSHPATLSHALDDRTRGGLGATRARRTRRIASGRCGTARCERWRLAAHHLAARSGGRARMAHRSRGTRHCLYDVPLCRCACQRSNEHSS
jgi:predicted molibdopterin-dependent oxidoreductase YjgC